MPFNVFEKEIYNSFMMMKEIKHWDIILNFTEEWLQKLTILTNLLGKYKNN
jgi:hypothetical protein